MSRPFAHDPLGFRLELHRWREMVRRCHDPKASMYKHYGARGIVVCDRWRESFANFITDMGPCNGLELDRIDNNGPYSPENCRWTDRFTNMNNTRLNIAIEHQGRRLNLSQWARETGISLQTISRRYHKGWPPQRVLSDSGCKSIIKNRKRGKSLCLNP